MSEILLHPAIPAATVVLFGPSAAGAPPPLLMVERSQSMAFAAGMLAFPGGRVDADDAVLAAKFGAGLEHGDAVARVAAIRETLEETGIALGMGDAVSEQLRAELRAALHEGALFSHIIQSASLMLDLETLVPFARWRPNFAEARIFDARFYLAHSPPNQTEMHIDDGENSSLFWASAADTLERCNAGDAKIIFPTRRNLERLALYSDFAHAASHAGQYDAARTITPWIEERADGRYLCIDDNIGYPITAEPMRSAMRG
jgi:8-oxo-dGTP pyrophosphatase MutT (NUDIX family)